MNLLKNKNYIDITNNWLKKSNKDIKIIKNATYVIKNGKRYYVNKKIKLSMKIKK